MREPFDGETVQRDAPRLADLLRNAGRALATSQRALDDRARESIERWSTDAIPPSGFHWSDVTLTVSFPLGEVAAIAVAPEAAKSGLPATARLRCFFTSGTLEDDGDAKRDSV